MAFQYQDWAGEQFTTKFSSWCTYSKVDPLMSIPVKRQTAYKVGEHVLACADMELPATHEFLRAHAAEVVYSDPPWGANLATGFRTIAAKHTGDESFKHKVDYPKLLADSASLFASIPGTVFLESGNGDEQLFKDVMAEAGSHLIRRWGVTFYRRDPSVLMQFSMNGNDDFALDVTGMDDSYLPEVVLSQYQPGMTVLDPFCGFGLTGAAAHIHGHRFVGCELNPRRLAEALQKLSSLTQSPIVRYTTI